jgi:carboxypeptidase PM20D1
MHLGRIPQAELCSTAVITQARASAFPDILSRHNALTYHCRILPGDTVENAIAHLREAAGQGEIRLTVQSAERPSGLSPARGPAWEALATAIQILFPDTITVPCLNYHTTDARCYEELGGNIYRFSPFRASEGEGLCPVNERISIENLELGIQFYQQMLQA